MLPYESRGSHHSSTPQPGGRQSLQRRQLCILRGVQRQPTCKRQASDRCLTAFWLRRRNWHPNPEATAGGGAGACGLQRGTGKHLFVARKMGGRDVRWGGGCVWSGVVAGTGAGLVFYPGLLPCVPLVVRRDGFFHCVLSAFRRAGLLGYALGVCHFRLH